MVLKQEDFMMIYMPKREINIEHFRIQHRTTMQYNTTLYHTISYNTILYGTQYFTITHTWHIISIRFFYPIPSDDNIWIFSGWGNPLDSCWRLWRWRCVLAKCGSLDWKVENQHPKSISKKFASVRFTRTLVESTKTKPNFKMKHLSSIRLNSFCFLRVPRPISKSHNACHFLGLPETQCEVQVTWLQTPTSCQMAKWGH